MKLSLALYLVNLMDNMSIALSLIIFFGCLIILSCFLYEILMDEDCKRQCVSSILKKYWILIFLILINIGIPSNKTMYMMLGTTYLEQSNLPKKVAEALELKLDDYIEELKAGNNKSVEKRT